MKKLEQLAKETFALNEKMHNELVAFVKDHKNLIRTDDIENKDAIYGIVDIDGNGYVEKQIFAVTTFEDNTLGVLFGDDFSSIKNYTDEELLELDIWYSVMGGIVLPNATLWCLCEFIEEYVNDDDVDDNYCKVVELLKDEDFNGYVNIADFGYIFQNHIIEYVVLTTNDTLEYWIGNPVDDKHAEQLNVPKDQINGILQDIIDMYL
jgi:hypothetical protein